VAAVVVVAAAVFAWAVVAARLERADLTAPIAFTAVGVVLAASQVFDGEAGASVFRPLVEVTLVWVLFADAARVPLARMRPQLGH
jgi:hypothetical protein